MQSRSRLILAFALLACGFLFAQPASAEETLPTRPAEGDCETNDSDGDADKNHPAPSLKSAAPRVTPDGMLLPDPDQALSLALVSSPVETDELIVVGFEVKPVEYPALPPVEGTRINSGKKTSFVKPDEFPTIANNNYREAMATTPGILVSEEPSSPIVNFGYRGLDSQRSEAMQILKDGVSIKNEQFGFPETHYTPILEAIERIEVIRSGAALQFGPQPGGAINFVTKMPRQDAQFHFETKNAYGTDEFFQDFTEIDGTVGQFGYYAYYDHRQREGFRENSDYHLNAGSAKLVYDLANDSQLILTIDAYSEEHGEPGGLTAIPAPGAALYQVDRNVTTRFFDRFRLERYYGVLEYRKILSEHTELDIKAFGGYLSRYSHRQRGGGFGVAPDPDPPPGSAASTDDIQLREDYTQGLDARMRHNYPLAGDFSTITGGVYFYHALQDRDDERGLTPDADEGVPRRFNTGVSWNGAIFAENRFQFGRFSVVPGARIEFLQQSLSESLNITKPPDELLSRSDFSTVPLFALGLDYIAVEGEQTTTPAVGTGDPKEMKNVAPPTTLVGLPRVELYATVAQAYRPRTYGELVPTSADGVVNGNLEEGHSLQFELGVRGKPLPYLTFDVSGFYYTFNDQVGEVTGTNADGVSFTTTENVGDARFIGLEAATELDILALFNGGSPSPYGQFNFYGNVTLLDAKFTAGPADGFTPSYAPNYLIKVGGIYRWKDVVKVGLLGTIVDDTFADANNTPERFIPSYTVWDLTAEVNFCHGRVGVFAGINNLFNENFYAEIRDEGIVPAYGRNYYGGLSFKF